MMVGMMYVLIVCHNRGTNVNHRTGLSSEVANFLSKFEGIAKAGKITLWQAIDR